MSFSKPENSIPFPIELCYFPFVKLTSISPWHAECFYWSLKLMGAFPRFLIRTLASQMSAQFFLGKIHPSLAQSLNKWSLYGLLSPGLAGMEFLPHPMGRFWGGSPAPNRQGQQLLSCCGLSARIPDHWTHVSVNPAAPALLPVPCTSPIFKVSVVPTSLKCSCWPLRLLTPTDVMGCLPNMESNLTGLESGASRKNPSLLLVF